MRSHGLVLVFATAAGLGFVSGNSHLDVEELFSEYFEWKMATHPQVLHYPTIRLKQAIVMSFLDSNNCNTDFLGSHPCRIPPSL